MAILPSGECVNLAGFEWPVEPVYRKDPNGIDAGFECVLSFNNSD